MSSIFTILYKTAMTALTKGVAPLYRFVVCHKGTIRDTDVYSAISRMIGQPLPLVRATVEMLFMVIAEQLRLGYRVELAQMSAFLTIPGVVESLSTESLKAAKPTLVAHLVAKGDFKKCCQGPEFVLENVTEGAVVVVDAVIDDVNGTPNVLTNGTGVEVHVTGRGLYMPDTSDPTVGAYIADAAGAVLVKGNVTESTATTLVCEFPQISLREGSYKFCVASRNGLDAVKYGVTVGSRNIQVVNAASAEEEQNG